MFGLALLGAATALSAQTRPPEAGGPAVVAADAGLTDAERARRARVLARVGTTEVTVGEVEDLLNEAPPPVRVSYRDPARRREFVENLVRTMLLAEEARRRGIDRQPDAANAARRVLAQRLHQVELIDGVTQASITDDEVRAFYDAHRGEYVQPEFRRATVVLLPDRATADRIATDARSARGDMRRVQALARDHASDASGIPADGDVFYFDRAGTPTPTMGSNARIAVDRAIAEAAFGLAREMDVGGPVETSAHQFAVVVLTGIRPPLNRQLTEQGVRDGIRGTLLRQRRMDRERQLLEQLRQRYQPELHEERVDQLRVPGGDLGNVPPFDPSLGAPRRPPTATGNNPVPPPQAPAR